MSPIIRSRRSKSHWITTHTVLTWSNSKETINWQSIAAATVSASLSQRSYINQTTSTKPNLNRRDWFAQEQASDACSCRHAESFTRVNKSLFESARATNLQRWISKSGILDGPIKRDFITARELIKMHAHTDEHSRGLIPRLNCRDSARQNCLEILDAPG